MKRKPFTVDEIEQIRLLYPDHSTREIAQLLGRSECSIYGKASLMGLRKSPQYIERITRESAGKLSQLGSASRFKKGHTPANKGRKMSAEMYERCSSTMFRKGHKPHNTRYDGYESIRTDKNGYRYIYVRIAEGRWMPKHILIWKQANGPVPNGHNIVFRDGDMQNCVLENLECISDAELMRRNTMHNLPEDVQELIYLKARLTRAINETNKNKNHERT